MTTSSLRRSALLAGATLALILPLTACGSKDAGASGQDVAAALAKAKQKFDESPSVHFTMSTGSTPTHGDAVLGADGTLTHQPAFQGQVKALFSGFNAEIPIVAVDGKVYGKIPLTPKFAVINPAEYGAPNPADFADPASGFSGLLTQLVDARSTGQQREGKSVVTTYSGTLPGSLIAPIIPSADASGTYQTVVGIDENGYIITLKVTGDFFSGSGDVTYDLAFDNYGKNVTISAP